MFMMFEKGKGSINWFLDNNIRIRWGILVLSTILFVIILYPSLVITKHQYNLGDVVELDIKAPEDFFIEDQAATEKNRQQAATAVLTVYDYDANLANTLKRKVDQAFVDMRTLIEASQNNKPQETENQAAPAEIAPEDKNRLLKSLIKE
jgi:membrane-associated HD superfamily phosphohydrolase